MSSRGRLVAGLAVAAALLIVLAGGLPGLSGSAGAQGAAKYYSETGHFVRSPFYEFFVAHGEVAIFGYPITEALEDPEAGTLVQYFQRARMEVSPIGQIRLAKLASDMGYAQRQLAPNQIPPDSPYQRYFPIT